MRTVLAFCVIITLVSASMADLYTERSFAITGTNFVFQFEDSTLSVSNRQRIADDILMIRSFGVSSEIENDPIDGFDGYIYDDNLEDPPGDSIRRNGRFNHGLLIEAGDELKNGKR